MSTAKGINRRDFYDCTRSGAVLMNLLGTHKVSIGTVMEIAWAFQARVPVIVVMEKDNIHRHAMIEDSTTYLTSSLDKAYELVKFLFND
jgi:nucleoside 2-deoxyribosyltransferase